jgi:hypothetical protein
MNNPQSPHDSRAAYSKIFVSMRTDFKDSKHIPNLTLEIYMMFTEFSDHGTRFGMDNFFCSTTLGLAKIR